MKTQSGAALGIVNLSTWNRTGSKYHFYCAIDGNTNQLTLNNEIILLIAIKNHVDGVVYLRWPQAPSGFG